MKKLTLGSLFDGSGGFPLGGVLCGIEPKWKSEIEPFAIAVTNKHFPEVKHYGDVSKIDGGEVEPVDIITFGSPCQDLSVAGKRAGLENGERSNLFYQAIRIIKERRIKVVTYKNGDLLTSDCNVICHQVNCKGVMNAGIAKTIRKKYPEVYKVFIASFCEKRNKLGDIDVVYIQKDHRFVMNLYAQFNYRPVGEVHTDYDAFRSCLKDIKTEINDYNAAHGKFGDEGFKIGFLDHIGCGLAGGDWEVVKAIIEDEFSASEWNVEIWKL